MNKPIQIRALTVQETTTLLQSARFNTVHPTRCLHCENTQHFTRRVFWVGGVPKAERSSDQTQGLLAYHFKERYGVESIFFKTHRTTFYVDSAQCSQCGSTRIEFDLELSDDFLAEVATAIGRSLEDVRRAIQEQTEKRAGNNQQENRNR